MEEVHIRGCFGQNTWILGNREFSEMGYRSLWHGTSSSVRVFQETNTLSHVLSSFFHTLLLFHIVIAWTTSYKNRKNDFFTKILGAGWITLISTSSQRPDECAGTVCKFQFQERRCKQKSIAPLFYSMETPKSLHISTVTPRSYYNNCFGKIHFYIIVVIFYCK